MKTCAFYTLGCKVNQYETQSIRESFLKSGYKEVEFSEPSGVYVINTCTVTEKTDKESRRLIRKAGRQNPKAKIVVTGCYAELDANEIKNVPGVSFIIKNADKDKIARIIDSKKPVIYPPGNRKYSPLEISDFKDRSKAFLKIQDGCSNFCSYCKVPLVRGSSVSRDEGSVIAEAERLIRKGFKEIILTGICLGAWGGESIPKKSLSSLLVKLAGIDGDFRIRLSSIEPKYVDNGLLETIKRFPKLCRHLHVPFQSGDNKILKMMSRPYTFDGYVKIIRNARRQIPAVSVTTDILIGFPGEGDGNFRNTCKLIETVRPSRIHIFPYSKRSGTVAADLADDVPKNVIAKRLNVVNTLALRASYEYRKKFLGKATEVLVEAERNKATGLLKGYDDKYINILINGSGAKAAEKCISGLIKVRIQKVDINSTYASIIPD